MFRAWHATPAKPRRTWNRNQIVHHRNFQSHTPVSDRAKYKTKNQRKRFFFRKKNETILRRLSVATDRWLFERKFRRNLWTNGWQCLRRKNRLANWLDTSGFLMNFNGTGRCCVLFFSPASSFIFSSVSIKTSSPQSSSSLGSNAISIFWSAISKDSSIIQAEVRTPWRWNKNRFELIPINRNDSPTLLQWMGRDGIDLSFFFFKHG